MDLLPSDASFEDALPPLIAATLTAFHPLPYSTLATMATETTTTADDNNNQMSSSFLSFYRIRQRERCGEKVIPHPLHLQDCRLIGGSGGEGTRNGWVPKRYNRYLQPPLPSPPTPPPPPSAEIVAVAVAVVISIVVLYILKVPQGEGRGPSYWDVQQQHGFPPMSPPPLG